MQFSRKIKGSLFVLLMAAILILGTACTQARIGSHRIGGEEKEYSAAELSTGMHYIEGYIAGYDKTAGTIVLDPVEFITTTHHERITALGLKADADFHNGYYVNNVSEHDTITLKLADSVQTRFAHTDYNSTRQSVAGELTEKIDEGADRAESGLHRAMNDTADALHGAGTTIRDDVDATVDGVNRDTANNRTTAITNHTDGVLTDISDGIARALGGVAGGITGGLEMLGERFMDGKDLTGYTPYFITIKDGKVTHIEEVHAYSNFARTNY